MPAGLPLVLLVVVSGSIALQLAAAREAVVLLRITGRRTAWGIITGAIALGVVQQVVALVEVSSTREDREVDVALELVTYEFLVLELVALGVAALLFFGLRRLHGFFGAALRAERTIEESEKRFRSISETANDALVVADGQSRILYWNPAATTTFGYPKDEALGLTVAELVSERDRRRHEEGFQRFVSKDASPLVGRTVESVGRRKDGSEFPVEVSLSGWRVGEEWYLSARIRDLTRRRRADVVRRLQSAALEAAANAIFLTDHQGIIQSVNSGFTRLTGYAEDEVRGRTPRILKSGRHDQAFYKDLWDTVLAGRVWHGELVNRRKDGSLYAEEQTITPLQGADGQVTHMIGIKQDITQRQQAEARLRRSEREYRALVDHARFGIYRSTVDGRLLTANAALADMLGYGSPEELIEECHLPDLYQDPEARDDLIRRYQGEAFVEAAEVEWKRKGGQPITVLLTGRPVRDADGALECFEMFAEDVTVKRSVEEQLRHAQKMEAIGRLTGGIAHDFNNELSVIFLTTELLLEELEAGGPVEPSAVHDIQDAARRASEMTRQLLGFSRKAELAMIPVDLAAVVRRLHALLRRVLPGTIQLGIAVNEGPHTARADTHAVEQMLINLATNARDAMPRGGVLQVEVERVEVGPAYEALHPRVEPGSYVSVSVADNGVGMDEATRSKLFEPFFTTKPKGAGTGLGMAMVHGLVEQHGGFVNVYSEAGQGTVIRLYFPAIGDDARPLPERVTRRERAGGSETILLVEDDDALRRTGRRVLERSGYTVLTASDGEEALALFRAGSQHIDLILSDLVMPRLDGAQLYRRLEAELGTTRFILASGYAGHEARERDALGPSIPFVQKPWVLSELLAVVRRVLDEPARS